MTDQNTPRTLRYAPHAAVLSVGYVLFGYAAVPALLVDRLGIGFASFGLLMSAALLSFVLVQGVAGRLTDRYSTTRVLLAGTAAHAALAVALDVATTFGLALALRLLWGLAGGLVLSVGAAHVAGHHRGSVATLQQGVYGGMASFGGAVGFLLVPRIVAATGGPGLYAAGAVLALPAIGALWRYSDAGRSAGTDTGTDGSSPRPSLRRVATHPVVVLASLFYVAVIGSNVTISTFITAYFDELGLVGPLNAFVMLMATLGRAAGGVAVWRGGVGDTALIGGSIGIAAVGLGALAVGPGAALVVALPLAVMFGVSVPFGAIYNVAASATVHEGRALATVIAVGNFAALVLPAVTGLLRDVTGGYRGGFALLAAVNAAAVAGALVLYGRR